MTNQEDLKQMAENAVNSIVKFETCPLSNLHQKMKSESAGRFLETLPEWLQKISFDEVEKRINSYCNDVDESGASHYDWDMRVMYNS